jgi:DHA1 family bicyclomycin/chloramphenicol resistance-like MFS transporter
MQRVNDRKIAPIWLLIITAGFSRISEGIYSPSLPSVAKTLAVSPNFVEHSITIFLIGFATGSLFWGIISDFFGRKNCMLAGFLLFALGCLGCYFSTSIYHLLAARLLQSFGCSVSSVLSQAIARDSFQGPDLPKIFSSIAIAISIFPAISPLIGGAIAYYLDWRDVFIFLTLTVIIIIILISRFLPETHLRHNRTKPDIMHMMKKMLKDKQVIRCAIIIGGCNGLGFSFLSEGPFYFINSLGMHPSHYANIMLFLALATILGATISRRMNNKFDNQIIINRGLKLLFITSVIFAVITIFSYYYEINRSYIIIYSIIAIATINIANALTTTNALSISLINYQKSIGTASSLFGFFYYIIMSITSFFMGLLYNGTILVMPLYFLAVTILIYYSNMIIVDKNSSIH